MQGLSPITDFMVIGTGTSPRQMRTVVDQLARSGDETSQWIVVDFVDVVCHVFSQDARHFYDLDNLWGDAKRVEWEQTPAGEARP